MTLRYEQGSQPQPPHLEIAGALQAVMNELPNRRYSPDINQGLALEAIGHNLVTGTHTGYVEMPTGGGKTGLESWMAEAGVRAHQRVLMLAPKIAIADQLVGKDGSRGLGKFTDLHQTHGVHEHYGRRRATAESALVVTTYDGLLQEYRQPRLGNFGVIIGDESHRSLGPKISDALINYMPQAAKIGFSATPDFAADRRSEEVWGKSMFELSLLDAIEAGRTAPVQALLYETDDTIDLSDRRQEFTDAELAPLIENAARNGVAVQLVRDWVREGRSGIVTCIPGSGNLHARLMANLLSRTSIGDRNIRAKDIGGHLSREDQDHRLELYKSGAIDVLVFTKALEEGWDSDRASFCINMSPTTSPLRIIQLLGRIMRRKLDGMSSIFVDFVDTTSGLRKQQYTALHALGIVEVDITRVLGQYDASARTPHIGSNLGRFISPELYARLMRSQGKLLQDVFVSKQAAVDPVVALWERKLINANLPAELPQHPLLSPKLQSQYDRIAGRLLKEHGIAPSAREVFEHMDLDEKARRSLAMFARRVVYDEVELAQQPDELDPYAHIGMTEAIEEVLTTLSEREAGMLRHHFGFVDGFEKSEREVGEIYGISKFRVGQIEARVKSKLRHESRSGKLRGFIFEDDETPGTPQLIKVPVVTRVKTETPRVTPEESRYTQTIKSALLDALQNAGDSIELANYRDRLETHAERLHKDMRSKFTYERPSPKLMIAAAKRKADVEPLATELAYCGQELIHLEKEIEQARLRRHYRQHPRYVGDGSHDMLTDLTILDAEIEILSTRRSIFLKRSEDLYPDYLKLKTSSRPQTEAETAHELA